MGKRLFLLRLVVFALTRRKSRVAIAFAAIVLGVAIVSALANVYYDIGQKMTRELRTYGANLVLTPASPEKQPYLSLTNISDFAATVPVNQLIGYSPYLFGVARTASHPVVLAGIDFSQISRVAPYWKITGAAPDKAEEAAVVGEALAKKLGISTGDRLELTAENGQGQAVIVNGILSTGGEEDNLVFIDLDLAGRLLNLPQAASVVYFSIAASPAQLDALVRDMKTGFPGIEANLIKQVSQAEGKVLVKIQSLVLLAVAIILLLTLLCVVITMMNIALERRREIGLRKALGGEDRDVILEFVIEGDVLGFVGGILGWGLGLIIAQGIGQSVFNAPVAVRLPVLPLAIILSTGLAGLAAFVPARLAARIKPAIVLRGE